MLEVLVKANPTKVAEVPIQFDERHAGESKFDSKQMVAYLKHLFLLILYKHKKIVKFGLIGITGMAIHFPLLYILTDFIGLLYILSAILAIIATSTSNYFLNHLWTFNDRATSSHATGWTKYQVLSATTDGVYLGLLALFVEVFGLWYMLGAILSIIIVFPVKFGVASTFIWSRKRNPDAADYDWVSFYKGNLMQKWWKGNIANIVWNWIPASSALLDIGCGSSPIISHYPNAIGIDINNEKLAFIKNKCPTTAIKAMSADSLIFKDNNFDYVLCVETIEHLQEPEKVISEISRVVKSGGKVIIATPDYGRLWWYLAERFTPTREQHINKFTKKKLDELCKTFGLSLISYKYVAGCDYIGLYRRN